jgi:hypothetical protein
MKTIDKNELYQNLSDFLKSKGVELTDGTYSQRIQRGCGLLTDAINATQKTVKHAKVKIDRKLDQLRQSIHEATAPDSPPRGPRSTGGSSRSKRGARSRPGASRKKPPGK